MTNLVDPRDKYARVSPPDQSQNHPGVETEADPVPDIGLDSYTGSGKLAGRKALITGGDSGIGAAVAVAYAREGADVAIAYLPEEQQDADRVIAAIEEAGRTAVAIPGDLCDANTCVETVTTAVDKLGGLDILVNNASRQIYHEDILEITDEDFDATMKSNLYSSFRVTKEAVKHLPAGSSIIFTSSIQAYDPSETLLDYAMTKAAMNNFAKGLSMALLSSRGIRVNAVAPGPIWTVIQPSHGQPPEKLQKFGHGSETGRAGQPAELAGAYVYLASEDASYVSGATLPVTGGALTP
ncbi:SDR family oxidoreductase [Corynebacterium timonense]|uniref:NAD(P)-dependent dehydrogenase, short-chain alcohol dehydrogenase family n=1 Tax=Corynebacterium timonense TaxID=441500 RepID=A0A1H1QV78_9CORY|nr:SDR family oxidoreductase [Corynebacterium timonense]SDS26769.1 NAD(P)-dependent dehydrogenase, short-chain alcohol dehydrogenase family [Corynebacterium timonense]